MTSSQSGQCNRTGEEPGSSGLSNLKARCLKVWRSLNPLIGDSVRMSVGTAIGASATILAAPVLSRLYEPSTFGMFAVYGSLLSLALPVASLRYEMAVPIEHDDVTAANLVAVSVSLCLLTSLIFGFVAIAFPALIDWFWRAPGLDHYMVLFPAAFLLSAVYQVFASWAVRGRSFSQLARTRVSQSVGCAVGQISIGAINGSPWGLFGGDLAGRLFGTRVLFQYLARTWPKGALSWRTSVGAMRRYVRFPLYTTWASVLTLAGSQLPVLILSRSFSLETAGWYALTTRVLGTPSTLVGQALGQAFLGHAAQLRHQEDKLRAMTESTAGWIFAFGLPVFLFIGLEGKGLFAAVFGARWAIAGVYAQLLAPLFCLWMVASPLNHLLTIREWQGTTMAFAFLHCATTVISLYAGLWLKSPKTGIAYLGAGLFLLTAANLDRLFRAGYSGWGRILRRIAPMAGCAVVAIMPLALVFSSNTLWTMSIRFLIAGALYALLMYAFRLYPSASWEKASEQ